MATKDERPTLLSKVALFVRNPTRDWSELDSLDSVAPSGYDRAALKAAIERKRRNDFVRKREFDQLRKLRKSAAAGEVAQVRPSSFQTSSILTDPDGRAQTLEKIDQIEAQMSQQWWKGRTQPGAPDSAHSVDSRPSTQVASTQLPGTNFPCTEPLDTGTSQDDFVTTQSTQDEAGVPEHLPAPVDFDLPSQPRRAPGPVQPALPTDPELEEAAIRFANGDDAGAQGVLLQALRSAPHAAAATAQSWWAALLDAYRCSGDRVGFEAALAEFGHRFGTPAPAWEPAQALASAATEPPAPAAASRACLWSSPRRLGAPDMERLRQVLAQTPMPWALDWSALVAVDPRAQSLLGALFTSLCAEPVVLHFAGADALRRALRALTPPHERQHALWALRLDALRVMQCVGEFEAAALDYCVACGVEPPPWMEAACAFHSLDPQAPGPVFATDLGLDSMPPTAPMSILPSAPVADACLQGQLSGDATPVLAHLADQALPGRVLVIGCAELVRVDFAAAGSLLNWAAHQQALGCTVEFCDLHRLVAAFFNVIGVNEHARIHVRGQ
ncbi:MAG: STAS domain-containing protein [Rhodoferax sp.]